MHCTPVLGTRSTKMVDNTQATSSRHSNLMEIKYNRNQPTTIPALAPYHPNVPPPNPQDLPPLIPLKDKALYCQTCKRIFIQKYYQFCHQCKPNAETYNCKKISHHRKHGCGVCGQWFKDMSQLILHWDGHTTTAQNFSCQVCRIWR